jgi:hypothetical protein
MTLDCATCGRVLDNHGRCSYCDGDEEEDEVWRDKEDDVWEPKPEEPK